MENGEWEKGRIWFNGYRARRGSNDMNDDVRLKGSYDKVE